MFLIDPEVLLFRSKHNFNHPEYYYTKYRLHSDVISKLQSIVRIREMFNSFSIRRISK